jgi:tetratricopeptide (TPR) repeat protein
MSDAKQLIEAAWQARREDRHGDAERDLLQAIALAREANARMELIHALKVLAHLVRDLDQNERALPLYEEAVTLCRHEQDPLLLAQTVRHLGDLHRGDGRLVEADRCYSEALSLYRAAPAPPALDFANAIRPAALLKEAEGDLETAKTLWSEAQRLYEAVGLPRAVEECSRRLSRLAQEIPL